MFTLPETSRFICETSLSWSSSSELFVLTYCSIGIHRYSWKMVLNRMIKAAGSCSSTTGSWCMSPVIFLGASGKIKHLFVLDSKESVDILVCIFAKSLASKALLQLIACSIKECTAKYWFQGFSCASVSGTSALPHLSSYPQLIFQLLLSLPHNLNKNKGLDGFSHCVRVCACTCERCHWLMIFICIFQHTYTHTKPNQ